MRRGSLLVGALREREGRKRREREFGGALASTGMPEQTSQNHSSLML